MYIQSVSQALHRLENSYLFSIHLRQLFGERNKGCKSLVSNVA